MLAAWREFLRGKKKRKDVAEFSVHLLDNIFVLHKELRNKTYRHGGYRAFKINDPKPRDIHKASVRDRLLHHAIYRILYPYFDRKFIYDSYSCRIGKGTHRANQRLKSFANRVSRNHTQTVWILKCDIRKFFASINHSILLEIIQRHLSDSDIILLLQEVIGSFHTDSKLGVGLPLGNLTSQLLVNIYMNAFDHFVKRELRRRYYIRYADDFVVLHDQKEYLENLLLIINIFLINQLHLALHPQKVSISTIASGVDFLGWIHFTHHRVLRTTTRRRMMKNLRTESLPSYLGLVSHGNGHKIAKLLG